MEKEIWVPIFGYEGRYEISNKGKIRNNKLKILQTRLSKCGYERVSLRRRGQKSIQYLVHRLVAEAFIPNPYNKTEVNHLSGVRDQNNVENLSWVTREENQQYSYTNLGRKSNLEGKIGIKKLSSLNLRRVRQ
jgi:hypothetical protein